MLKEKILTHIANKDMGSLKTLLSGAEDMEILYILGDLSSEDQAIVFRLLSKDKALYVFEQLDTTPQQKLLRSFTDEKAVEFVNELAPDDRVRLLEEVPAGVAKKLIDSLSDEEREATNLLLGYQPETAGRIMTTEYISLKGDMTAEQALEKVRLQSKEKETIYTLFITDQFKKLEGVLSLKELLMADVGSKIKDIMHKKVIKVSTGTDQEEVAKTLKELDLLAIPVVDNEDRLVGIVTVDDALDILEEEATEEVEEYVTEEDAVVEALPISEPIVPTPATTTELVTLRFAVGNASFTRNGVIVAMDAESFNQNGRVMLPLHAVGAAFGANVSFENDIAFVEAGAITLAMPIDVEIAGGLGTPVIVDGHVFVPLGFVATSIGAPARWDSGANAAYVYTSVEVAAEVPVAPIVEATPVVEEATEEAT